MSSELKTLLIENNWHQTILDEFQYLNSLNFDEYCLDLQDPNKIFPIDPEEWSGILIQYGYITFGSCPNGDFIALDCTDRIGSVVYVSHEEFHYDPTSTEDISTITRHVANSIKEFITGLDTDSIPLDYYE